MAPVAILWDLQHQPLVADRVVVVDGAFLLNAEGVRQSPREGHEGRALAFGGHRETGVVAGQINVAQERFLAGHHLADAAKLFNERETPL